MPLFNISDTNASIAGTDIPDADIRSVLTEDEHTGSNSSTIATITITMTAAPNE